MKNARWTSGEPLTILLIVASIAGGIALAVGCSYRPIALWWVMVGASLINVFRFAARLSRQSPGERAHWPAAHSRLAKLIAAGLARSLSVFARGRSGASKASLDRQHSRFLVWFTEHNLVCTTIGFGVSLLLWHRFGPTIPALVAMAALMACGLFAALGAAVGAAAPTLGLCWREPCRTPDLLSPRSLVHDIGCVVVLANRRDFAARADWAKGGRFHELFLTVDELARAGIEPGLEAVLDAEDPAARRALARKERVDRAVALTPVFVAGLLAASFVVPPFAGSEPLPSLWAIVARNANAHARASGSRDENARNRPSAAPSAARGDTQSPAGAPAPSPSSSSPDTETTTASRSGPERPDLTGGTGDGTLAGDAVASGAGDGRGQPGRGAGAPGGQSDGGDSGSSGGGGRGGGPQGYGTGGVAPQRAETPNALPDAPVNPGSAIEVVLPAFSQARDDSPGDDPNGTKRKAKAPELAPGDRTQRDPIAGAREPVKRDPVQRWPNWVFRALHK